ncbi:hypothetical protein PG985_000165 [Apiospora marii]|uniref:Uncharacterized protein n=1 Tax=Apiospora marii TaxID=335849 RepID=A0ABR1R1A3_9PEZI
MRREFDDFLPAVPKEIKEANDSCLLIKWILDNCDPYPNDEKPAHPMLFVRGNEEWDVRWETAGNLWQLGQAPSNNGYDTERILQRLLVELRYMTSEVEEDLERCRQAEKESDRDKEDNPYTVHPVKPTRDGYFEDIGDDGRDYRQWEQQEKACGCHP